MESIETKSRVFFGGLLCEAFFFMLRENTFVFKFLSRSRCYRRMKTVRPNRTATATYKADSNVKNTNSKKVIL